MNKLEMPKLFKDYDEIEKRENFNPDCGVTLDNFKSLIGPYVFSEKQGCQIDKPEGHCGRPHRRGWLGLTKDGEEALIGGHCARKYFQADANFAMEKRRINREISISDSLDTLNSLLSNRVRFEKSLETEFARMRQLRSSRKSLESRLPQRLLQALYAMAKTGSRSVSIQIQYIERDEGGNEKSEWVEQPMGNISGSSIWLYSSLGSVFALLTAIEKTLGEVTLTRDAGEKSLKKWSSTLSELSALTTAIDKLQADYASFIEFDNLMLLTFLIASRDEQVQIVRLALEYRGDSSPSDADAEKLLKKMEAEIRAGNGNRNFRVAR